MSEHFEFSKLNLKPEAKLLVLCSRMQLEVGIARQITDILEHQIDWDYLLQLAQAHDVIALLYRTLESVAPLSTPPAIRAEFKKQLQIDIQGNLSLTRELVRVMSLFAQQAIPAIPYKGPMIAAAVYRDLAARPFTDLDILIHEHDIHAAIDLLVASGYEVIRPQSLAQVPYTLRPLWITHLVQRSLWAYHIVLWNSALQTMVELHWRVTSKYIFPGSHQILWQDLQPVSISGTTLYGMAPENLLWFLCLHASKHQWERLRWVCDIAELIRVSPNLNWERVIHQAESLHFERRLYVGLLLTNYLFTTPLPSAIQKRIDELPQVKTLTHEAIHGFCASKSKKEKHTSLRQTSFQLRSMDRVADLLRYFLRYVNDIEAVITAERRFIKHFSFLSLSARLFGLRRGEMKT